MPTRALPGWIENSDQIERIVNSLLAHWSGAARVKNKDRLFGLVQDYLKGDRNAAAEIIALTRSDPLTPAAVSTMEQAVVSSLLEESIVIERTIGLAAGSFAMEADAAIVWARDHALQLAKYLDEQQRLAISTVLESSLRGAGNGRWMAEMIYQSVDLTPQQMTWALNRYTRLTAAGYSQDAVIADLNDFTSRMRVARAETIARTEINFALAHGRMLGWQQAQRQGLLRDPEKYWIVGPGACEKCRSMMGKRVGLNEPFDTPFGPIDNPPVHPRCRCATGIQTGFLPVEELVGNEAIEILRGNVGKHLPGQHDQSSHGGGRGGGSDLGAAIDSWVGSSTHIRRQAEAIDAGMPAPADERGFDARARRKAQALIDAVESAPLSRGPLYRFISTDGNTARKFTEGSEHFLSLAGFTPSRNVEAHVSADPAHKGTWSVHFTLAPGAHALSTRGHGPREYRVEGEQIVRGRMRVEKAEAFPWKNGDGGNLNVTLTPLGLVKKHGQHDQSTHGHRNAHGSAVALMRSVQGALTDDLRRAPWKGSKDPYAGHCYVASEALYHLLGGKESGWTPQFVRHENSPHWFLRKGKEVLDPTASQFKTPVPYDQGKGKGFLTRDPSARARTVMERVGVAKHLPGQHDQASHGRRGTGAHGVQVTCQTDAEDLDDARHAWASYEGSQEMTYIAESVLTNEIPDRERYEHLRADDMDWMDRQDYSEPDVIAPARQAFAMMRAVADAPPTKAALFRGINPDPTGATNPDQRNAAYRTQEFVDSLKVGSTIDLPLATFSPDRGMAEAFGDVVFVLAPGARATPGSEDPIYTNQGVTNWEFVTSGRFVVTQIATKDWGDHPVGLADPSLFRPSNPPVTIWIEQQGVWDIDHGNRLKKSDEPYQSNPLVGLMALTMRISKHLPGRHDQSAHGHHGGGAGSVTFGLSSAAARRKKYGSTVPKVFDSIAKMIDGEVGFTSEGSKHPLSVDDATAMAEAVDHMTKRFPVLKQDVRSIQLAGDRKECAKGDGVTRYDTRGAEIRLVHPKLHALAMHPDLGPSAGAHVQTAISFTSGAKRPSEASARLFYASTVHEMAHVVHSHAALEGGFIDSGGGDKGASQSREIPLGEIAMRMTAMSRGSTWEVEDVINATRLPKRPQHPASMYAQTNTNERSAEAMTAVLLGQHGYFSQGQARNTNKPYTEDEFMGFIDSMTKRPIEWTNDNFGHVIVKVEPHGDEFGPGTVAYAYAVGETIEKRGWFAKHLPGRHDQSTHGRKGGRGALVTPPTKKAMVEAMIEDEVYEAKRAYAVAKPFMDRIAALEDEYQAKAKDHLNDNDYMNALANEDRRKKGEIEVEADEALKKFGGAGSFAYDAFIYWKGKPPESREGARIFVGLATDDAKTKTLLRRRYGKIVNNMGLADLDKSHVRETTAAARKALNTNPRMQKVLDAVGPIQIRFATASDEFPPHLDRGDRDINLPTAKANGVVGGRNVITVYDKSPSPKWKLNGVEQGGKRMFPEPDLDVLLKPGEGGQATKGLRGTLRHETGHIAEAHLHPEEQRAWQDIYFKLPGGGTLDDIHSHVSFYAAVGAYGTESSREKEAFAEVFSIVTHPDGYRREDYPKESWPLLDFMEDVVAGKKKFV